MVSELGPDGRPAWSLRESAQRCSVSLSTIRRRHQDGAFPQAFKGPQGEWRIPVSDLIGAGLTLSRPMVSEGDHAQDEQVSVVSESPRMDEVSDLKQRLSEAERRAAVAEALAHERGEHIETLKTSLRMLNPGPPVFRYEHQESSGNESKRPGWWSRLRGQAD